MCEILGYSSEEMMGRPLFDFMDKEEQVIAGDILEKQKDRTFQNFEFRFISKSGNSIWTSLSTNAIFGTNQEYKGSLAMVSDITKKRELQNLLDKSNRLAGIGSWEIDVVKGTVYWSDITKEIREAGHDFVPDLKTGIHFFKEGDSRDTIKLRVKECIENGTPWDEELQIVTQKGNLKWIRTIGDSEFLNGKCTRVYGSLQDIDATKRIKMEVLKAYEEKNTILESIGDAFFAVDHNWVVTYWNNQAEKMLHTPKINILGKHLWEVFSGSIESASYKNYHKAIETQQLTCFKDYYESLNKWFEINAYPSGNGLSVFFKDITEQRKSEVEREKMTDDIIQRNTVLEQFSYIVSHNLRAPVANIIGIAAMVKENDLKDDVRKKVMSALSTSVNKLDEVIKDLNAILKIRKELNEHTQMVSFTGLTNDIRLSIESMIETAQAVITLDFCEVGEMLTIKSYLHSIFYNLISNSLKYRRADTPPFIEIRSERSGDKIVLHFKDNGLGIDLEKRGDEVFGLYKRFHIAQAEGKGMGLYMVKTQVEAIGGKISLSSEVNKGTAFKIEF